jgi:hypothetical protein
MDDYPILGSPHLVEDYNNGYDISDEEIESGQFPVSEPCVRENQVSSVTEVPREEEEEVSEVHEMVAEKEEMARKRKRIEDEQRQIHNEMVTYEMGVYQKAHARGWHFTYTNPVELQAYIDNDVRMTAMKKYRAAMGLPNN